MLLVVSLKLLDECGCLVILVDFFVLLVLLMNEYDGV